MGAGPQSQIAEALKLLWLKFLPQMQERLAVLEQAGSALQSGTLTDDQRTAAGAAAHKLAGVLGTFGLTEGTSLAREAEEIYASTSIIDDSASAHLRSITAQLAHLIQTHR